MIMLGGVHSHHHTHQIFFQPNSRRMSSKKSTEIDRPSARIPAECLAECLAVTRKKAVY